MIQPTSSPLPEATLSDALSLAQSMAREQLALWVAIGRTIQAQAVPTVTPLPELAADDPLNATEEDMAAEDALWDATTEKYAHKLDKWVEKIRTSPALPMFDANGRWLVDDYTEADFEKLGTRAETE